MSKTQQGICTGQTFVLRLNCVKPHIICATFKMKRTLIFLNFVFLSFHCFSQYNEVIEKDYTISIPKQWISLSNEILDELQKKNVQGLRSYIIGFSESDSIAQSLPFLTVSYNEIPGSENALFKDAYRIQSKILKDAGHEKQFVIDSTTYKFYTEQELNNIVIYRGYSIGGNGILYLNYYTDSSSPDKDKLQFTSILNSVQHKIKFRNKNTPIDKAEKHIKKSGKYATMALIALGLLLIVFVIKRIMNK